PPPRAVSPARGGWRELPHREGPLRERERWRDNHRRLEPIGACCGSEPLDPVRRAGGSAQVHHVCLGEGHCEPLKLETPPTTKLSACGQDAAPKEVLAQLYTLSLARERAGSVGRAGAGPAKRAGGGGG